MSAGLFRFRWRRRQGWSFDAFDAYEGPHRVAQVLEERNGYGTPSRFRWHVHSLYIPRQACPTGMADTAKEAALAAEAAFNASLPRAHGFNMRTEDAIALAERLGIELPPQTRWQAARSGLIDAGPSPARSGRSPREAG